MGNIISTSRDPFRFLDLPPELRNEVYRLTLHHNRNTGSKATPALLRTCKQVYAEGIGMLNAQSTLSLKIANFSGFSGFSWNDIRLSGDLTYSAKFPSLSDSILGALPPHLPAIRNINLHLEHSPYYQNGTYTNSGKDSVIHRALRDLAASLGESKTPKTITCLIEIGLPNRTAPAVTVAADLRLSEMFEPLYGLPSATKITVATRANPLPILTWLAARSAFFARIQVSINAQLAQEALQMQWALENDVLPRLAERGSIGNAAS